MSSRLGLIRDLFLTWLWGLKENIRFAANALVSHKLRSALTTLGIIIGVMTVIAMVSVIEGFNNNIISGNDPMLTAGQVVTVQIRQSDGANTIGGYGDNLTNGMRFTITP